MVTTSVENDSLRANTQIPHQLRAIALAGLLPEDQKQICPQFLSILVNVQSCVVHSSSGGNSPEAFWTPHIPCPRVSVTVPHPALLSFSPSPQYSNITQVC
jgi:hypothetical protein